MNKSIKIFIVLLCLPLLVLGLGAMFNPMGVAGKLGVIPESIHALNTIRGDLGGLLLGTVVMMVMGLWRNNTTWFLAAALIMGMVAFGRLIGFVVDGVDVATVPPLVVEFVIMAVMVLAYRKLGAEN